MATFMERLAFLQKVPTLMKATADDESPCPGYLFQEIGKISHESSGCGQCLLEYLLERLQVESCHVKLKVLKILVHLCGHGSGHFLTELRRNSTFIQQASVFSGPPDPVHGTALYQRVRNTAQEVARLLFTDKISTKSSLSPGTPATPSLGMGSAAALRSGMQGFGYSPAKQGTGSDTLLEKIQKAAEVVASAVLPPTEHQGLRLHDNHYRPVVAPSVPVEVAVPACAYNLPPHRPKVTRRCPGQVGGGWEETDSGNSSSHNSSQDNTANSRTSENRSSRSGGTGSQSGASRESSGEPSERCSTLNCEVVVELLSRRLQEPSNTVQMRALSAVACLMTSDLLSLEQIFGATQRRLAHLSESPPGPVANKSTKILRQFDALMDGSVRTSKHDTATNSHVTSSDHPPMPRSPASLLPSLSADITQSGSYQGKDLLFDSAAEGSTETSGPSGPASRQTGSPAGPVHNEETVSVSQDEKPAEGLAGSVRTSESEVEFNVEDPGLPWERGLALHLRPQAEPPCLGRLSLFSGMELVTRGISVCRQEKDNSQINMVDWTEEKVTDVNEDSTTDNSGSSVDPSLPSSDKLAPLTCDVTSSSSPPLSAFSFLNC
ncbi:AP-4 complex accessory subunit tepsin isoform X4 [Lampris incognitus]|uniref:AP-4 complex accessory subunit tepsin isoform X4 n=1 Tax=Lampris incognitus TaxID=2546036 RepID=UPI0024B5B7C7|nr:AP-4 complex accessory subunit tepsin isoform X4 [Lampris incognitus]